MTISKNESSNCVDIIRKKVKLQQAGDVADGSYALALNTGRVTFVPSPK